MNEISAVTSPRLLRELLLNYGLQPNKLLGQNFLIDANIARKITAALDIQPGDAVVEVGPGAGALTLFMAPLKIDLLAIEIDWGLFKLLEDILKPWPAAKVIRGDALKISWQNFIATHFSSGKKIKLVSNLPYVISGPFMYNLFKEGFPFTRVVLMLQKEVALRLIAEPGERNYGALSVISSYFSKGRVLFNVSNQVFWPRPKVDSAVLELAPRQGILKSAEEKHFISLVQTLFQQRRKTMLNNLNRLIPEGRVQAKKLLEQSLIDPAARPEDVSMEQFAKLTGITYNYVNHF